jgi:hypothetical protein
MRYKATFIAGLATGYVLGAKAGRVRYEQISRFAASVRNRPIVQGATESLGNKATSLGSKATSLVDSAKSTVSNRVGGRDVSSRWVDPAPIRI